jgi:hypothetical protein
MVERPGTLVSAFSHRCLCYPLFPWHHDLTRPLRYPAGRHSNSLPGEAIYDFSVAMTRDFLFVPGVYTLGPSAFRALFSPDAASQAEPSSSR